MERLCTINKLDNIPPEPDYPWRDILMEEMSFSKAEYQILSQLSELWKMYGFENKNDDYVVDNLSNVATFCRRVGITYEDIVSILKTKFVNPNSYFIPKLERLGLSFANLSILYSDDLGAWNSWFSDHFPKGAASIDPREYGYNQSDKPNLPEVIRNWLKTLYTGKDRFSKISNLIVLMDPNVEPDKQPEFEKFEFRYAIRNSNGRLDSLEFIRLLRFIRLWKKLGWTIRQTDAAISALYQQDVIGTTEVEKLNNGFLNLLPRLGIVVRVMKALNLTPERDLLCLLACWSDIDMQGENSLYKSMFLNPALLNQHPIFADNGYGEFMRRAVVPCLYELKAKIPGLYYDDLRKQLSYDDIQSMSKPIRDNIKASDTSSAFQAAVDALYAEQFLITHTEALRSALNLSGDEFNSIIAWLKFDAETPLTISNISKIFRLGWLARKLQISVRELVLLIDFTVFYRFAAPDITEQPESEGSLAQYREPPISHLIAFVNALREHSIGPNAALYMIWNQDISGKSNPNEDVITSFTQSLRVTLAATESQFAATDDPESQLARSKMTLVYGKDAAELFFSLIDNTLVTIINLSKTSSPKSSTDLECCVTFSPDDSVDFSTRVPYKHATPSLEKEILDSAPGLAYDDSLQQLTFNTIDRSIGGVMTDYLRGHIETTAEETLSSKSAVDHFKDAVEKLYSENQLIGSAHLEQSIVDAASGLSYYESKKQLSFIGIRMTDATRNAFKVAAAKVFSKEASMHFCDAIDQLYAKNQQVISANLEQSIVDAVYPCLIVYDDLRKQICFTGVVTDLIQEKLGMQRKVCQSNIGRPRRDRATTQGSGGHGGIGRPRRDRAATEGSGAHAGIWELVTTEGSGDHGGIGRPRRDRPYDPPILTRSLTTGLADGVTQLLDRRDDLSPRSPSLRRTRLPPAASCSLPGRAARRAGHPPAPRCASRSSCSACPSRERPA